MKFFLIMDTNGAEMSGLARMLEKAGHEIIYWVGTDEDRITADFPHVIFHDYLAACAGIPAKQVQPSEFPPLGAEMLKKLYRVESLTMAMINSAPLRAMSAMERRHLYYELAGYWSGLLKKYHPDFILFTVIPHSIYNYLIYELARHLGIKTLMFENSIVSDRALAYRDFWAGSTALQKQMAQQQGRNFQIADLRPDIQTYYQAYQQKFIRSSRQYVNYMSYFGPRAAPLLKIAVKAVRNKQVVSTVITALKKRFGRSNSRKDYQRLEIKPDLNRKFVYAALNYQQERSTSPQGDIFYDQILMLQILAASLPPEWVIYVKEHPNQWRVGGIFYSEARFRGYYQKIASLANVFLIPVETDNYSLIEKSQAVAVVTGTPGWEAVLWSKPAIVFGYPWYRDFPNLLRPSDVQSCRQALEKIAAGFAINQQEVINYLKALDDASYRFFVDDFDYQPAELSRGESLKNFENAVTKEIQSYV